MTTPQTKQWADTTPKQLQGNFALSAKELASAGMLTIEQRKKQILDKAAAEINQYYLDDLKKAVVAMRKQADILESTHDRELIAVQGFYDKLEEAIKNKKIKIKIPSEAESASLAFNDAQSNVMNTLKEISDGRLALAAEFTEIAQRTEKLAGLIEGGKPEGMQSADYFKAIGKNITAIETLEKMITKTDKHRVKSDSRLLKEKVVGDLISPTDHLKPFQYDQEGVKNYRKLLVKNKLISFNDGFAQPGSVISTASHEADSRSRDCDNLFHVIGMISDILKDTKEALPKMSAKAKG